MKKLLTILALALSAAMLTGCIQEGTSEVGFHGKTDALQGCKVYKMHADDGNSLYVARCEGRSVASINNRVGKSGMQHVITIEAA